VHQRQQWAGFGVQGAGACAESRKAEAQAVAGGGRGSRKLHLLHLLLHDLRRAQDAPAFPAECEQHNKQYDTGGPDRLLQAGAAEG